MSAAAPSRGRRDAAADFDGIAIALNVEDEAWTTAGLGDVEALARACVSATAGAAGLPADLETEIGVTLTDDARIRVLNARWRGRDEATNVLSFPMTGLSPGEPPGPMLGDLVLARQTLHAEAIAEKKGVADHFCHLLVHGMLHCLGHDHEDAADAEAMEALEVRILGGLGIADPYAFGEPQEEPS